MRIAILLILLCSIAFSGCVRQSLSGIDLSPVLGFHRSDVDHRRMESWNDARVLRFHNTSDRRIEWCVLMGRAGTLWREFLLRCPLDPGESRHLAVFATLPAEGTEWTVQQIGSDLAYVEDRHLRNLVYLREDFLADDGSIIWEMVERFGDDVDLRPQWLYLEFSFASLLSACWQSEERAGASEGADIRILEVIAALWSEDGSAYQDTLETWLISWMSADDLRPHSEFVLSFPYRTPMDYYRMQVKLGIPIDRAQDVPAPFDRLLPLLNRRGIDQRTALIDLAFDPTFSRLQAETSWNLIGLAGGDSMRACLQALDKIDDQSSNRAQWLLAGWRNRDPTIMAEIQPEVDLKAQLQALVDRRP